MTEPAPIAAEDDAQGHAPRSPSDLFWSFSALAMQGFGGVLAVAQRMLCEQKRWLSKQQYLELLSLGQVLPGPNVCNLSLMVGDRWFGLRGAFAALAGMMLFPLVLVLLLAALYGEFASHPAVAGALRGMGAVSAGMVIGSALRLARPLRHSALGLPMVLALGGACFVAIALLRWPLGYVLPGLGIVACVLAWKRLGDSSP
ncbi:chromate transporter [Rivibacter subsaxonicus]|uniref:Chromate transporter n=1 Tax=Rivibacter subsaxonicus TaxID=457575 RepID=A0A4Q7W0Z6_9BURK|nr:chromate transporter [Rivibacter subsaxonicus]RZU02912.1 chromate transporter [Rivibacter subsaxonicus]